MEILFYKIVMVMAVLLEIGIWYKIKELRIKMKITGKINIFPAFNIFQVFFYKSPIYSFKASL